MSDIFGRKGQPGLFEVKDSCPKKKLRIKIKARDENMTGDSFFPAPKVEITDAENGQRIQLVTKLVITFTPEGVPVANLEVMNPELDLDIECLVGEYIERQMLKSPLVQPEEVVDWADALKNANVNSLTLDQLMKKYEEQKKTKEETKVDSDP